MLSCPQGPEDAAVGMVQFPEQPHSGPLSFRKKSEAHISRGGQKCQGVSGLTGAQQALAEWPSRRGVEDV